MKRRTFLVAGARGLAVGRPGSLILDPLGGAVADVAPGASAFRWCRSAATAQWYVPMSTTASADAVRAAYRWIRAGHEAFGAASVGGYVNHVEPGRPLHDYHGRNFARLRRVKAAWDPDDFFHGGYTVPPA